VAVAFASAVSEPDRCEGASHQRISDPPIVGKKVPRGRVAVAHQRRRYGDRSAPAKSLIKHSPEAPSA
jgi:hypothetical protein